MSDQTRRDLLITIGHAALAARLAQANVAPLPLPPGIYLPSPNHLSHALMSSEEFHTIPADCPTDYLRPHHGPFIPLFFSTHEFATINKLIELLLGGDEGASSENAGIAQWIDLRVWSDAAIREAWQHLKPMQRQISVAYFGPEQARTLHSSKPEAICHQGLSWLTDAARLRQAEDFISLKSDQQVEILSGISDEHPEGRSENAGVRFFDYLKGETIRGFYTSQTGLKELDFKGNAYYAKSPGCNRPRLR